MSEYRRLTPWTSRTESVIDDWLERERVRTLSDGQIARLIDAVDQYAEQQYGIGMRAGTMPAAVGIPQRRV
jgi:hypothetical protein